MDFDQKTIAHFRFSMKHVIVHEPPFAWSYDFLVLFFEICRKNYIGSWGLTFGTPDFDLWVRSVPASRSEVPRVEKINS